MPVQVVQAVRHYARAVICWLYWTTDASTYDPMLKKGLHRVWLDGLVKPLRQAPPASRSRSPLN